MSHIKRHLIPKPWKMGRKWGVFAVRPCPGPHRIKECIPLQIILREILGYAETSKEARNVLNSGKVMVDKKVRKDPKFPTGFMDVVEIPELKQQFRVLIKGKNLSLGKISQEDSKKKTCKITGKTTIKRGIMQICLHDGRNIRVNPKDDLYNTRDSLVIALPEQKILKHLKFQKGMTAVITGGRNIGREGKIKDIRDRKNMFEKSIVIIETKEGEVQTPKEYVFVTGG